MQTIRHFTEGPDTNAFDLARELEKVFLKHLPNSYIMARFSANLMPAINVNIALGHDSKEWANGIFENDPMSAKLMISGALDKEGKIGGELTIKALTGGKIYFTDGTKSRALFRKRTASPGKIIDHFEKFIVRMKETLKANAEIVKAPFDIATKL